MLVHVPFEEYIDIPFGSVPKGSILSYQAVEIDKPQPNREERSQQLPSLPLDIIENVPCALNVASEEQCAQLIKTEQYIG